MALSIKGLYLTLSVNETQHSVFSVIMLNVVMRSAIMMNVVIMNVVILSVVAPEQIACLLYQTSRKEDKKTSWKQRE
jgi:hypothetical protein